MSSESGDGLETGVVQMIWLVAQDSQQSNAEQAGAGFAQMISGAADWLSGFAASENGRWLGYAVLLVLAVWVLRRIGIMRS